MASVPTVHTKSIGIIAKGRGSDDKLFLELKIAEPGHATRRSRILSIADYKSKRAETETALGLPIVSQKASNEFRDRVQAALKEQDTFDVAQRPGWYKGSFVLPNSTILKPIVVSSHSVPAQRKVQVCLPIAVEKLGARYRTKGFSWEWQELCRLAEGNSRLMMSIALAFAGPLGELLGGEQPMIQLVGAAESGKSSIAIAAGSVWGEHNDKERKSFSESWNNTANNLEPIAAAHDATFLILDETGLFESTNDKPFAVIRNTVMRLNKGITKGRKGQIDQPTWWMGILSTSNKSLEEMAEDAHTHCPEALRSRLIDVPMPIFGYGAYERLHGLKDERSFSVKLQEIASNHYGKASVFFIRRLATWRKRNPEELNAWLSTRRELYRRAAKARIEAGKRKFDRVTESFATIHAAGCAAIELKVLTWSRRALGEALLRCEQAHVEEVTDKLEDRLDLPTKIGPADAWRLLREYVSEHRSEFIDLRQGLREDDSNDDGFGDDSLVYVHQPKRGDLEYLFSDWAMDRICGFSKAWEKLKPRLRSQGWLVTNEERFVVKRQIFKKREDGEDNRASVVAIRAAAFENEVSNQERTTSATPAEAAPRPAQATSKTIAPSPAATRHSRPVNK